jgi:hypothetical protein
MVVVADTALIAGRAPGRLDPADQSGGSEGAERLIYRLERHMAEALADRASHLISTGMVTGADGFEDRQPH